MLGVLWRAKGTPIPALRVPIFPAEFLQHRKEGELLHLAIMNDERLHPLVYLNLGGGLQCRDAEPSGLLDVAGTPTPIIPHQ